MIESPRIMPSLVDFPGSSTWNFTIHIKCTQYFQQFVEKLYGDHVFYTCIFFIEFKMSYFIWFFVKPLLHKTAIPQRLYVAFRKSVSALWGRREICLKYQICQLQRPYSVHSTYPQRPYSVHDALTARKKLLQHAHGAHTAFSRRSKRLWGFTYFYILSNTFLQISWPI